MTKQKDAEMEIRQNLESPTAPEILRDNDQLTIVLTRNAGHPWHGRSTDGAAWDRLEISSSSEKDVLSAIERARKRYWQVWLQARRIKRPGALPKDTDPFGAVLYKPSGATGPWQDPF
jgi:hypothetical protein